MRTPLSAARTVVGTDAHGDGRTSARRAMVGNLANRLGPAESGPGRPPGESLDAPPYRTGLILYL